MKHQTSGGQARLTSSRRKLLSLAAGGALAASVPGCASPDRGPAVPSGQAQRATVLGIPNERFYPASGSGALEQEFIESFTRLAATKGLKSPLDLPKLEALAISGGGENGAFGAGLLNGWTEQGTRPEFEIVTGISTGALTAPFSVNSEPPRNSTSQPRQSPRRPQRVFSGNPCAASTSGSRNRPAAAAAKSGASGVEEIRK